MISIYENPSNPCLLKLLLSRPDNDDYDDENDDDYDDYEYDNYFDDFGDVNYYDDDYDFDDNDDNMVMKYLHSMPANLFFLRTGQP